MLRICASLASVVTLAATPVDRPPEHPAVPVRMFSLRDEAPRRVETLSVLTYNVHGLPALLRKSETAPLAAISDRLLQLRRAGSQPDIVLLQESFTGEAKRIGAAAGYRYIVDGPAAADAGGPAIAAAEPTELDRRSYWWAGEGRGKYVDSGLQILSDLPVLGVKRLAFAENECAGFDCLANKGVLLVTVALPGQPVPVDIVTTHLNSRGATGVPHARSFIAYRRQVARLFAFLAAHRRAERPLVFAGDLNIGAVPARRDAFFAEAGAHRRELPLRDVMALLADRGTARFPQGAREAQERAKDWQFWTDGTALRLEPMAIRVPFGREPDGSMLSDHIGFAAEYRLSAGDPS